VLVDLRDPSREMLAATALTFAGIVPPHLSYSPGTSCVTQEWLWSVGGQKGRGLVFLWSLTCRFFLCQDSPLSHTSHGLHFGRLHRDMAARNFVFWALEQSYRARTSVVQQLLSARTFRENFGALYNASAVQKALHNVMLLTNDLLHRAERLHWEEAIHFLEPLQGDCFVLFFFASLSWVVETGNTSLMIQLTNETLRHLETLRCAVTLERMRKEHRGPATSWRVVLLGACVLNVVALAAWAVMSKRKGNKVKIN
jgi:hypothetical protein